MLTRYSGRLVMYSAIRSPFLTPSLTRALAKLFAIPSSSRKDMCCPWNTSAVFFRKALRGFPQHLTKRDLRNVDGGSEEVAEHAVRCFHSRPSLLYETCSACIASPSGYAAPPRHGKIRTSNTFCQRKTSEYCTTENEKRHLSPGVDHGRHTHAYVGAHQSCGCPFNVVYALPQSKKAS